MDISNFNFEHDSEGDTFKVTVTQKLFQQIVKEEDEYTMNMIEEYVKNARAKGECIAARIIPEGQLRHIINLGLSVYNDRNDSKILGKELFPQEQYIEFLRRELVKEQYESQKLRNQLGFGKVENEEL